MTSMADKYTTELRDRDPSTVDELYLDNATGGVIEGIDEKLTNLTSLSIVNCQLTSFKGLPSLPSLTYIDASNNQIGDSPAFDILVKNTPDLERLNLSNNVITSIEILRPLKMLAKLNELDLCQNKDLGLTEEYRDKIFSMIPSLKSLDGCDADGEEVEETFDNGGEGESSESDDGDEQDGPGLSYLNNSRFSDDETDDYEPAKKDTEGEGNVEETRGTKRTADESTEEPEAKKTSDE